jgi:hypothetical protein
VPVNQSTRVEFVARNPGFERSRMYGHLFKGLTVEETRRVEWLRLKLKLEAQRWITSKLAEYKKD